MVTIFSNIFSKEAKYITIETALERIKTGKSLEKVNQIRLAIDKERSNELKKNLPSVCFSGKFGNNRTDAELLEHSGFICLDFDDVEDCEGKKTELIKKPFVLSAWVSPSGKGVKALVKIADPLKHREHFQALQDIYPDIDKSGINVSRVCYESYDPQILINKDAKVFKTIKTVETVTEKQDLAVNNETFTKILKWLSNTGNAFVKGERNFFLFKLASACCRYGLTESDTELNFTANFNDNDFSRVEAQRTIKSAYRANSASFNTAFFDKDVLKVRVTKKEVEFNEDIYNLDLRPKDVIFGEDVKAEALDIYDNGYQSANSTHVTELDYYFKWKRCEITLLSGIGNYGKSTFLKYLLLLQVIYEGKKMALFSPEDNPAAEFYHDLVEMYFGMNCTPSNQLRPPKESYEAVYDIISKHVFYVYPKDVAPTPEYIKERFLELIIKEKIDFCIIDPFNQMANDYSTTGGRDDKYLETVLSDFTRFAQVNNIYFVIVAHPTKMMKTSGNYDCPDVFNLAGGAMWNNKMDNILIYHRPERGTNPDSMFCEVHTKKIRRQKIVGKIGTLVFELSPRSRRYIFNGSDYIAKFIDEVNMKKNKHPPIPPNPLFLEQKNEDPF